MSKQYRIFLGYTDVSSNLANLAIGMRKLGHDVTLFDSAAYDQTSSLARRFATHRKGTQTATGLKKLIHRIAYFIVRLQVMLHVSAKHDFIIISFGGTLFNYRELKWYKFRKKKILYWFHGSDSRPPVINKGYEPADESRAALNQLHQRSRTIRDATAKIEAAATAIVCPVSHAHYFNRKVIDPLYTGKPFEITSELTPSQNHGDRLRIVHAPSKKQMKGSKIIAKIVKELQDEGHPIDYIEITGVSHGEVLKTLATADIVIDQLYSDIPVPSITKEAGFLGKPSIVGGYFEEVYRNVRFIAHFPPIAACRPDDFKACLLDLVTNTEKRRDMGAEMKEFFTLHYRAEVVALHFICALEENPIDYFLVDPKSFNYLKGCGYSAEEAAHWLEIYIDHVGLNELGFEADPVTFSGHQL